MKELLDLGVEPNAIEEELNFESTSWPVLLGAYIGIAQSDKDLDEIIRRGKEALRERKNKEADIEYKKRLGQYIENFLQKKSKYVLQHR